MPRIIPLFPLNLVAFPGEQLNLHIFEPRYRQMVKDCMDYDLSFGIVPVNNKKLADIGTEMDIIEIAHVYPDGKMDISTQGKSAFNLLSFQEKLDDKLYSGGEIELLTDIEDSNLLLLSRVFEAIQQLYKAMNMSIDLPEPNLGFQIYSIAHKIALNNQQELELLAIRNESERLEYVLAHLENMIPLVSQMEELRYKVKMNGHFKDALPPDFKI
jgi:Lon protease-like protein